MTIYTASDISSKPRVMGEWGDVVAPEGHVSVTAALAATDKVRALIVPAGEEVRVLLLAHGDLDTGTGTLVADVGYEPVSSNDGSLAASQNYFKASDAGFAAVSDGRTLANFDPIKFEQDVFITITCTTGANAMAAAATVRVNALGVGKGTK